MRCTSSADIGSGHGDKLAFENDMARSNRSAALAQACFHAKVMERLVPLADEARSGAAAVSAAAPLARSPRRSRSSSVPCTIV